MGNGNQLAELFMSLGYPEEVHPQQVDWLFSHPSIRIQGFLEWMLQHLQPHHSVAKVCSEDERQLLLQMKKENKYLTADQLNQIPESSNNLEETPDTSQSLFEEDITQEELDRLKQRIQQKRVLKQELAAQVRKRRQEVEQLRLQVNTTIKNEGEQVSSYVLEKQQDLHNTLVQGVQAVQVALDKFQSSGSIFLLQKDLQSLKSEERLSLDVMKKLMTTKFKSSSQSSESGWFHASDPETFALKGNDVDKYDAYSLELARLQIAAPLGEEDALRAKVELAKREAYAERLKLRESLQTQYQMMTKEMQLMKIKQMEQSVIDAQTQLGMLMESTLPEIYDQLAELEATSVLLGDYQNKFTRQEQLHAVQEQCIQFLTLQQQRCRTIANAVEEEAHLLDQFHQRLKHKIEDVRSRRKDIQNRMDAYILLNQSSKTSESTTKKLDPNDILMHHALHVLQEQVDSETHGHAPDGTHSQLMDLVKAKKAQEEDLVRLQHQILQERETNVKRYLDARNSLRQSLFSNPTCSTIPQTEPDGVVKGIKEADECVAYVEKTARLVLTELQDRQVQLQQAGRVEHQVRDLFTTFFLEPKRLQEALHSHLKSPAAV